MLSPQTLKNGSNTGSILALDVGERRIGVAMASLVARLPGPLTTLLNGADVLSQINKLVAEHQAQAIVVGLPRGLGGQETGQTTSARQFADKLKDRLDVPVYMQDEAVTSRQAEAELQARGKPYAKEDVDSLSATYILEDFLREEVNL